MWHALDVITLEASMQTSRFQLGLIAFLAAGFGYSLSSSDAVGYPSGAAVSVGTNPLWTYGGETSGFSTTVFTAPADQDMVLTDLSLSTDYDYDIAPRLTLDDGTELGYWVINGSRAASHTSGAVNFAMTSGIRIPQGQSLVFYPSGATVRYSFSGYYARP